MAGVPLLFPRQDLCAAGKGKSRAFLRASKEEECVKNLKGAGAQITRYQVVLSLLTSRDKTSVPPRRIRA
jgi:hypothetical protein